MEAHFCQCDEKTNHVSHYNEKLSQNIYLVSQSYDLIPQNNDILTENNDTISK